MMRWRLSHRADPPAVALADRHYSRQKPGTPQFVPPGRCIVLLTLCERAVWVTSWPFAQYVKHEWAGAWICSIFRNEGAGLSSDLVREALAATASIWTPPELGLVTFVDAGKVRKKRDPGRCFIKAGGKVVGKTKGGLVAIQFEPADIPQAQEPVLPLFASVHWPKGRKVGQ